jgi:NAD(P)-dependent dehydrogenase (short-subunit alcohol dehydrogenase family)
MVLMQKGRAENKVVLITGGGTGIGRATALRFSKEGASVVLMGRRKAPLVRVSKEITENGGRALPIQGDVTDEKSVHQVVLEALERYRKIDVLINNAGIAGDAVLIHKTTDQMWRELIEVNLTGSFRMVRAVLPHFLERKAGIIVNVSSMAALVGMPNMAAYSISKSGMIALTKCIAVEYGYLGIRCNCVCPGMVLTPMTEDYLKAPQRYPGASSSNLLMRVGKPYEIAESILFLGLDESSFVTGAVLNIDGGYTAL